MKIQFYALFFVLILAGCFEKADDKPKTTLNGAGLIKEKCAKCHNLDMPPKSFENERAPSMMAVTFHLKDFIKGSTPADHEQKVVSFIKDYVMDPSRDKSYCDKQSLDSYGVMPSQKGNVTLDELEAIARYMYHHYDNKKLLKIMQEKQRWARMSIQERVEEKYRCQNCHDKSKDKVAPSFEKIAKRYDKKDKNILINSIKNGSKGKYKGFKIPMPPFKKMSDKEINGMVDWILSLKK